MATYKELKEQRRELDKLIEAAMQTERRAAIEDIRVKMDEYHINADELTPPLPRKRAVVRGAMQPKYRNPDGGATWSGRGRVPQWIEGKNRDDFLIPLESLEAAAA